MLQRFRLDGPVFGLGNSQQRRKMESPYLILCLLPSTSPWGHWSFLQLLRDNIAGHSCSSYVTLLRNALYRGQRVLSIVALVLNWSRSLISCFTFGVIQGVDFLEILLRFKGACTSITCSFIGI